jgi:hypothetical protein
VELKILICLPFQAEMIAVLCKIISPFSVSINVAAHSMYQHNPPKLFIQYTRCKYSTYIYWACSKEICIMVRGFVSFLGPVRISVQSISNYLSYLEAVSSTCSLGVQTNIGWRLRTVLRKIFVPTRKEMAGSWRKSLDKECRSMYCCEVCGSHSECC